MKGLAVRLGAALLAPALVLLGLGGDLGALKAEPARGALLLVLAVGRFAMGGAYRFTIDTTAEAKSQVLIPLTVITLTLSALVGFPWLDLHPDVAPWLRLDALALRWSGVVLFALGIGIQAWATLALGRWFSPRIAIQPGHELIQTGPYAWVRHPFYTGLLACVAGFPTVFGAWVGLPAAALAFPVVLYRVRVEEGLLEDEFGAAYRELRSRTKRLVPMIY